MQGDLISHTDHPLPSDPPPLQYSFFISLLTTLGRGYFTYTLLNIWRNMLYNVMYRLCSAPARMTNIVTCMICFVPALPLIHFWLFDFALPWSVLIRLESWSVESLIRWVSWVSCYFRLLPLTYKSKNALFCDNSPFNVHNMSMIYDKTTDETTNQNILECVRRAVVLE